MQAGAAFKGLTGLVLTLAAIALCNPSREETATSLQQRTARQAADAGAGNVRPLKPVTYRMQPPPEGDARAAAARLAPSSIPREAARKPVVIDVVIAYTKRAAANYADIKGELLDLAVEQANESFRASQIGHVKLRLVHTYQTDYLEQGEHFDHLWRFADRGDGHMEEIHHLRDVHRGDVALLIVDDAKGCGLATRVLADAEEAFAVIHHGCAATSYTLAHEIGHLIGARHELSYVNGTKWRDIMSYKDACGGCPRIPVWSNPMLLVNGEPAGTVELDNARVIAEHAARVAAFRD